MPVPRSIAHFAGQSIQAVEGLGVKPQVHRYHWIQWHIGSISFVNLALDAFVNQ